MEVERQSRCSACKCFCTLQEEDTAARRARAAAAAEQRKEREAGRRRALAMKAPATAVMTQQQRGRVEEVLAQLRQAQVSSAALPGQSLLLLAGPYMDSIRCYAVRLVNLLKFVHIPRNYCLINNCYIA